MNPTRTSLRLGFLLLLSALPAAPCAGFDWVPFRIAGWDEYYDQKTYDEEASSVYGLRLGFGSAVNKDVYGLSLTLLFDGGVGSDVGENQGIRSFVDNDFIGLKMGAFMATAAGSGIGVQLAGGISRTAVSVTGFQLAGLGSQTAFLNGFQLAGVYSSADISMHGLQFGGAAAICGSKRDPDELPLSSGIQLAGLYAGCDGVFNGLQIALVTYAHALDGMQIGLVNYARKLHGIQLGLVNFSGSKQEGDLFFLPILNANF